MCNYGTAFVVIAILLAFLIFLQVNAVSVVVLVCESRLQLIMMPSEHQRIIWVLTNLLHKVGS